MKALALIFLVGLSACSTLKTAGSAPQAAGLDAQLAVTSVPGRLKAKLVLKNTGSKELVVSDLNAKNFRVEMLDGKAMPFRGAAPAVEPVKIKPGESVETAFSLQDNYPFWDRRTKYKITYDSPALKTNTVQVWF